MAQIAGLGGPPASDKKLASLSKENLFELEQYRKIAQLRDAIIAGTHPVIRVPPELLASAHEQSTKIITGANAQAAQVEPKSLQALTERAAAVTAGTTPGPSTAATQPRAPEINPIFLEKSAHLIRAEFKLQRQRSERSLRDEVEQRRPAKHAQPELATDLDISDVLSKALTRVPAIAAPLPAVSDTTANIDNRSNSFDDDTFYSSQHDTPDLQSSPPRPDASLEASAPRVEEPNQPEEALDDIYAPPSPYVPTVTVPVAAKGSLMVPDAPALPSASQSVPVVPGLNNYPSGTNPANPRGQAATVQRLECGTIAGPSSATHYQGHGTAVQPLALEAYAEAHPPSPLLRTHDLQPAAPQPSHHAVLPAGSSASNSGAPTAVGTPAQVAALRHDPLSATSPDSSPQGGRVPERKRSKKKKRKADRQAADADAVYIKPEPRSPSPLGAPTYIRPNKRARHTNRQAQAPGARYPSAAGSALVHETFDYDDATHGPASHAIAQGEPAYSPHTRAGQYLPRPISTAVQSGRRHSGGFVDSRGRTAHASYGAYQPQPYAVPEPAEAMYDYVEGPDGYARAVSHHLPYEGSRMSLRPETTPYVGIPRPQPQRIYVDSTGREYLEPRRPTVRQSVAPTGYYREPDVLYERVPPRAASKYAEPTHYVDSPGAYSQAGQAYPTPRRVVTQPEYAPQHYGGSHAPEYSRRSMMPPEVRMAEPLGHDYGTRAASVRRPHPPPPPPPPPPPALGEYTSPLGYPGGSDGRPDMIPGDFGRGAPLQSGQIPGQPYGWEYETNAAPAAQAAAAQRYYALPNRAAEDIAFIEEPRGATQEIVYADSGREEVYR
ncbi:hypothetical protein LIA77_07344 [Sarocladium implicatum]|nr:hypothetical protein LIA77_07344 [Sarocladium implicatum]